MSEYICIKKEHLIYKYTIKKEINYSNLIKRSQIIFKRMIKKERGNGKMLL